jgi:site-specific recombinase XerC
MKLRVAYQPSQRASVCPYRLFDEHAHEIDWANAFLDAQRVRQLSLRSLRIYAYDLLHFARWAQQTALEVPLQITDSVLLEYVRHQLDRQPPPTPQTVNHRLGVLRCLYRFHQGCEIPPGHAHFSSAYTTRSPLGYGRPGRGVAAGLRLQETRRVVVPLSADQVATFWNSFRTFRDLAVVGLMLLDGLRSCEVLGLRLEDLHIADRQMLVQGKGNRQRLLQSFQNSKTFPQPKNEERLAGQGAGNPACSRLSRWLLGPSTSARVPKEPAKSRLQPRLTAPLFLQDRFLSTKLCGINR